jgi:hypothetical protein
VWTLLLIYFSRTDSSKEQCVFSGHFFNLNFFNGIVSRVETLALKSRGPKSSASKPSMCVASLSFYLVGFITDTVLL